MNYSETIEYLVSSIPMFQRVGGEAYKPGLGTTEELDKHYNYPHKSFKTIHVGGTNGKGSTSHLLAAILQQSGYRVGLFTSPHLVDFRERIRVNGELISEEFVVDFVEHGKEFFELLSPSFFELTTAMAFQYFRKEKVDIAVIEVGMGGRLDCTNIIDPLVSVITNVSYDHMAYLGNTLDKIAFEKSGIIKPFTPIIIGRTNAETKPVFELKAGEERAPLYYAYEEHVVDSIDRDRDGLWEVNSVDYGPLTCSLSGLVQQENIRVVLTTLRVLSLYCDIDIQQNAVVEGFRHVQKLTGLRGRWELLSEHPRIIADTGHNVDGIRFIVEQLSHEHYANLRMVIGMVSDKDIRGVLKLLPKDAIYYFTQASIQRALPAEELCEIAKEFNLKGNFVSSVAEAVKLAVSEADEEDLIFVGGSSFIVADALRDVFVKEFK